MEPKQNKYHAKPLNLTAEEMSAALERSKGVENITVLLEEDEQGRATTTADYVICTPSRTLIEMAADMSTLEGNVRFINGCVLAGDMELLAADDPVYYAVLGAIRKKAEVKKLIS